MLGNQAQRYKGAAEQVSGACTAPALAPHLPGPTHVQLRMWAEADRVTAVWWAHRGEREGILQPRSCPRVRAVGAAGPGEEEQHLAPGRRRRPHPCVQVAPGQGGGPHPSAGDSAVPFTCWPLLPSLGCLFSCHSDLRPPLPDLTCQPRPSLTSLSSWQPPLGPGWTSQAPQMCAGFGCPIPSLWALCSTTWNAS